MSPSALIMQQRVGHAVVRRERGPPIEITGTPCRRGPPGSSPVVGPAE
jgi:hypothetical protein